MATATSSRAPSRERAGALTPNRDSSFIHLPRRSRARLLGALALMALGCWIAAVAYVSIGDRRDVLVVARSLPRYHKLQARDLRVARVASDELVATVDAAQLRSMLGRSTSTAISAGTLLNERALLAPGERPVQADEAVVGALLTLADAPSQLPPGAPVRIIIRPPTASDADPYSLHGRILDVTDAGPSSGGARRASLVVDRDDADAVSSAASDNRVAVVVLGASE